MLSAITEHVLPHWPFLIGALIFATIGQVMKSTVFGVERCKKSRLFWIGRKTLPLHPVATGLLVGLIPTIPVSPGVEGLAASALYWAGAGLSSTWAFAVVRSLAKKRGVELQLPGESEPPR